MKITDFRSTETETAARVAATVVWEESDLPATELYFETERRFADSLVCTPHAFLLGCIIPAFLRGEQRIHLDEEICPELRDGLMTALGWIKHWYYPADRELVRIEAKVRSQGATEQKADRAGVMLSGGIDSLSVLRWNRLHVPLSHPGSMKDAVVVQGLQGESRQTCKDILERLSVVAEDAGIVLLPVRTNIFNTIGKSVPWEGQWEGSVLAAVGHALAGRLTQMSIASSFDIPNMHPLGSHPLLDPNYGSSDLRIRHDGITLSRLAKTKLVAGWDTALQNVRVCNKVPKMGKTKQGTLNCGKCEKCIRTTVALLALGALHKTRAFPEAEVTADSIRKCVHLGGPGSTLIAHTYYEELIPLLLGKGRTDLVLAIREKLAEYHRYQKVALWKSRVKGFDKEYLGSGLSKLKRAILPLSGTAKSIS